MPKMAGRTVFGVAAALAGLVLLSPVARAAPTARQSRTADAVRQAQNSSRRRAQDADVGVYVIRYVNSGKCLDVLGWSKANHATVDQWTCSGRETNGVWVGAQANQEWRAKFFGDSGTWELINVNSGKCLDVYGWSTRPDAAVDQWTCPTGAPQANQEWVVDGPGGLYTSPCGTTPSSMCELLNWNAVPSGAEHLQIRSDSHQNGAPAVQSNSSIQDSWNFVRVG